MSSVDGQVEIQRHGLIALPVVGAEIDAVGNRIVEADPGRRRTAVVELETDERSAHLELALEAVVGLREIRERRGRILGVDGVDGTGQNTQQTADSRQ
jgi:ABC-type uncharacterized transport system ATPase subunit